MEANETHNKIINILKEKGPSLPIQISKQIGLSSLFVSAFLSELAGEKKIKISYLKVGGSPLYYLEGQEELLESFHKFLHPREIEAFLLLKKKKILKDSEQNPTTRVALRSIRDFAIGFKKQEEIYWRYYLVSESEVIELLKPKPLKQIIKKTTPSKPIKISKSSSTEPTLIPVTKPRKKEKPKSDFVLQVINFINNNYKLVKEKEYKPKEYNCIIQIQSDLGPINLLTQSKDKKTISEADLMKLLSSAQSDSLPAFMLYAG